MPHTLYATFDGEALRPDEPLDLEAGTRVRLTVEPTESETGEQSPPPGEPYSFFRVLESLQLEGPPDWSEHLDDYLTGKRQLDG